MRLPSGWREVPCVECGEFVEGINFGDRCPACFARRQARAKRIARRAASLGTLVILVWTVGTLWGHPLSPLRIWYSAFGVLVSFFLIRLIVVRFAMEVMK